ncbi:hypothetical protein SPFL3102_01492 [Sporomusaceae bacterium FL31]|nr:hypothetical protein SPFL3101_03125 [Sporomusaceae bacterium FL31]GCE33684.1 hypothetical protein SPFL3102_01492 [Sporomusaceae bacterium]
MSTALYFPNIKKPDFPLEESYVDSVIRTAFENGIQQSRTKFTRRPKQWPSIHWERMTDSDHTSLMDFFNGVTDGGSLAFNWTHPYTGNVKEVTFQAPPKEKLTQPNCWEVEISIREV